MKEMYAPGMPNSPQTKLASAISASVDYLPLLDASVLPPAPNLCMLGGGEDTETVLYTGKSGNTLTGVSRAFQGTAKSWASDTLVSRNFAEYDYSALVENMQEVGEKTLRTIDNVILSTTNWTENNDRMEYIYNNSHIKANDMAEVIVSEDDIDKILIGPVSVYTPAEGGKITIRLSEKPEDDIHVQIHLQQTNVV